MHVAFVEFQTSARLPYLRHHLQHASWSEDISRDDRVVRQVVEHDRNVGDRPGHKQILYAISGDVSSNFFPPGLDRPYSPSAVAAQ